MSYARRKTLSRYGQPQQPSQEAFTFPASIAGVNASDGLTMMQPYDCIYTYNMMPSEYGLRLRLGYAEWAINCGEDPPRGSQDVRSIVPFESSIQSSVNDRLFAVTSEGIWDVTLFNGQAPTQSAVFVDVTEDAGYGVFCEFTGDAADGDPARGHYLFYADGRNGLWRYTEASALWEPPVGGVADGEWWYAADPAEPTVRTAFPVADIAFVMNHKQRIWVILENDDDAWYLPVASVNGQLKRFTFGSKLPHGGNLVGLWTWSIDGGDGVDDYMVAIGRGGDVVIYQGEDPEITPDGSNAGPWSTRGTWFIGEIPESRRIVGEYGPNLYILSTFGLSSLADLLNGATREQQTPSKRVNRFLRADVERGKDRPEWQIAIHPGDGFLQIITPKPTSMDYIQYTQNLQSQAWGFWESVPIISAASWNGEYYMGGLDGKVYVNAGGVDNLELPGLNLWQDVPSGTPGPEWSVPVAGEYAVDGTQVAETEYAITTIDPLIAEVEYEVIYKIKDWVSGTHSLKVGGVNAITNATGDGVFVARFSPAVETSLASIVASANGVFTFYDVTVREARSFGEPIQWRTLTSFQAPQGHSNNSRVGLIRTVGVFAGTANVNARAIYDYRIEGRLSQPPVKSPSNPGVWDSAVWEVGLWDYETSGQSFLGGSLGVGKPFAVLCVGNSTTRVTIVSWDLSVTKGGYL